MLKKVLKKYWILLTIIFVILIPTLIFTTIRTNYDAYVPGSIEKVGSVVEIDSNNKSENYYSTSVYYIDRITLFQKLIFSNINQGLVYKRSKGMTTEKDRLQGEIEHNSAIYTSLISAYKEANIELDYKFVGYYVYDTTSKNLNIGDVVIGENYEDCVNNLSNDEIKILRNNTETTISLNNGDKVALYYPYYEINNDKIKVYASNNGGPSAGLMQALKLYDDLVDENLATKYKVGGTGTIDEFGNAGAIGCVGLKIYTAIYNNVDIFFIPNENKEEAEKYLKKIKTNMKIVYVSTLSEAISYLRGL